MDLKCYFFFNPEFFDPFQIVVPSSSDLQMQQPRIINSNAVRPNQIISSQPQIISSQPQIIVQNQNVSQSHSPMSNSSQQQVIIMVIEGNFFNNLLLWSIGVLLYIDNTLIYEVTFLVMVNRSYFKVWSLR